MTEIKRFTGLRNTTSTERLRKGDLSKALDIDIDDSGRILTRKGFTQVNAASGLHSLYANQYAAVVMQNKTLNEIMPDFTLRPITTLSTSDAVGYESSLERIFYSNGTDIGRLEGTNPKQWGIDPPVNQPVADLISGNLPYGDYQYALTFLRSDGHESGTGLAGIITIPGPAAAGQQVPTQGIRFTNIEVSTNPEISGKILYLTNASGEMLYRAAVLDNSVTTYEYRNAALDLSITLITQFYGPTPAGSQVLLQHGVMYVVTGDTIAHSKPYEFELFCMADKWLRFPGKVVMFEPVNDGIYVGTVDNGGPDNRQENGAVWFLEGRRPDQFKSHMLFDYGVIEGTGIATDMAYFGPSDLEVSEALPAVVWMSRHGVIRGGNGGQCVNLTERRYSFPVAKRGAPLVRLHRGYVQYLVTLQDTGPASNAYQEEI